MSFFEDMTKWAYTRKPRAIDPSYTPDITMGTANVCERDY